MFNLSMLYALTPIHADLIANVGYTILLPALAAAGMAQVGATLAVIRKTKNERLNEIKFKNTIYNLINLDILQNS